MLYEPVIITITVATIANLLGVACSYGSLRAKVESIDKRLDSLASKMNGYENNQDKLREKVSFLEGKGAK